MSDLTDRLEILVVIPKKLYDENKLGYLVASAEAGLYSAGWRVGLHSKTSQFDAPDGVVYDDNFRIRTNQVTNSALRELAAREVGVRSGGKRMTYVVFICADIIEYDEKTKAVKQTGTNGESINGQAISFIKLIPSTKMVGNSDGRTWAHEIGHGLGLEHVDNEKNLMHATRHGNGGGAAGFELEEKQVKTLREGYLYLSTQGF